MFNGNIFIKGFSTMLVPAAFDGDIVRWHLICKKDEERISYLDSSMDHIEGITISDLETSRHIVEWCPKARCFTGSAHANYRIDRSWLPRTHERCLLRDVSIKQSFQIGLVNGAVYGKKDRSLHILRGTYRAKVTSLSSKYLILWDVQCKRGWLVNGPSALLHLLRTSLELNRTDDLASMFLLNPQQFQDAKAPFTISAAVEVLMNITNLDSKLYSEEEHDENDNTIYYQVCDRVEALDGVLEKAIDYQTMVTGEAAKGLSRVLSFRSCLKGWDFKEIATLEDLIWQRATKRRTAGKGELIQPLLDKNACSQWELLPWDKYYLAVSTEDLSRIIDRHDNPGTIPTQLTSSIVWSPSRVSLASHCTCMVGGTGHLDLAQTILPRHMGRQLAGSNKPQLEASGALVFGYNRSTGWIWDDFGDPRKGNLADSESESDDEQGQWNGIDRTIYEYSPLVVTDEVLPVFTHTDYRIVIICALPSELMAVRALFDAEHTRLSKHETDHNTYALGRIGEHPVVAACLPCDEYGTNAAVRVASDVEKTFPAIRWRLVVGVGGGIPSRYNIRLGDVVVSTRVVQHDLGKIIHPDSAELLRTGLVQRPTWELRTTLSLLRSEPRRSTNLLHKYIQDIVSLCPEYECPGEGRDRLFSPCFSVGSGLRMDTTPPEVRRSYWPPKAQVHYGLIASGNQVIKDAKVRDQIGKQLNALCVEMEAAGVMATGQCLVIRGICDYADCHKNDEWHNYAAATAAAFTKVFLSYLPAPAPAPAPTLADAQEKQKQKVVCLPKCSRTFMQECECSNSTHKRPHLDVA
ncbi:hypothetical protein BDW74DRAFT_172625 [Aspergillus multicolor]|uniref:5'-methylthioadenosine/S-adenosylhomocysteine nucleosidase family protein n=1 Tax=Aspergillus multicolor TaxID=41759 RepID=UPI003CCDBA3F